MIPRGAVLKRRIPLATRLWARVNKDGPTVRPELGPCWVWLGKTVNGYGRIKDQDARKDAKTHRLSWQLANGPIPSGLLVLHRCDNPPCVRPDHLFLGTDADNAADALAKGRRRVKIQSAAPPVKARRRSAGKKLTMDIAREIRARRAAGETGIALAREYGVSDGMIAMINRGRKWKEAEAPRA